MQSQIELDLDWRKSLGWKPLLRLSQLVNNKIILNEAASEVPQDSEAESGNWIMNVYGQLEYMVEVSQGIVPLGFPLEFGMLSSVP